MPGLEDRLHFVWVFPGGQCSRPAEFELYSDLCWKIKGIGDSGSGVDRLKMMEPSSNPLQSCLITECSVCFVGKGIIIIIQRWLPWNFGTLVSLLVFDWVLFRLVVRPERPACCPRRIETANQQ